ncbi:PREDICTED: polygalacturonase At1g48100 isoform X2 [Tarenaya hassleriana]|uniref:polygalacturonase At1g48100 isoform X2 n=1 Tax=Tarenaya hassleriana TaxID=28532 RepID=UPI00053CA708|nr:PREDICTED: polygalacturonase At1g48100 isoform X2 [Tarenaya hassleriana]
MGKLTLKCLAWNVLISFSLLSLSVGICEAARHGRSWRGNRSLVTTQGENSKTFNVLDYGAKGDGITDDTKAFEAAWEAACKVAASTLVAPTGSTFLVGPISFLGTDCAENIAFQLDGKIIAPTSASAWGSDLLQWIEFKTLKGIAVRGKGTIDGQGSVWWNDSPNYDPTDESESRIGYSNDTDQLSQKMPRTRPTALRFYGSNGVTITGITIQNSPQTHLKFDDCSGVQVSGFTASSPGDSPNTDGIHLQNSHDVVIYSSTLACGDDCLSIQTGCSNVYVHNVDCGPGHGISIGGLGKDNSKACVSNITVRDVTMHNTLNGVRIKTWQGGSGSVQQVMFSNVQVNDVASPIVIDQYYCDGRGCQNKTSAVAVSGINYINIKGTYTREPVRFACSESLPCSGISLSTIELKPASEKADSSNPFCWEAYGELKTTTVPPIACLQAEKSSGAKSQSFHDAC